MRFHIVIGLLYVRDRDCACHNSRVFIPFAPVGFIFDERYLYRTKVNLTDLSFAARSKFCFLFVFCSLDVWEGRGF